jgi:beta-glucosidase
VHKDEPIDLSVEVENAGDLTAEEVVQFYTHQQFGSSSRPIRELKGFERVSLSPHQKQTVHFSLTALDRRYWSQATNSWVADPSQFDVWVGEDSSATLHGTFEVVQ